MRKHAGIFPWLLARSGMMRAIFEPYLRPSASSPSEPPTRLHPVPTGIVNGHVLYDWIVRSDAPNPVRSMLSDEEWAELEREALAGSPDA